MTASNWTQLLGIILQVGAGVFILIKGWQSWLDYELKKAELKYKQEVEISANQVELARHNSLSATQVADILKSYKEAIGDLEEMKVGLADQKKSSEEKISNLITLINKIEHMVEKQTENFTEFLMGKAR